MWILIDTGKHDGVYNMQFDEWLATVWYPDTGVSVFRVYGWFPPAISLGFHQNDSDVDKEKLHSAGYDLVRRPTGGRAILHAEEITYSVVTDATGHTIDEVYERISRALVYGLRNAGYDVYFAGTQPHYPTLYRSKASIPCFASSGKFEIQLNGRKVVGSAQRRYQRAQGGITALQHGSILTGTMHHHLVELLALDSSVKNEMMRTLVDTTTELSSGASKSLDERSIKESLFSSAAEYLAEGNIQNTGTSRVVQEFEKSRLSKSVSEGLHA